MSNVVDNPILNEPYVEPTRYWDFSGPAPQTIEGRRPAGYFGTVRTELAAGPVAAHEQVLLGLVNEIRRRVGEWHKARWPGVTPITRDLLEHWSRADRRPLF